MDLSKIKRALAEVHLAERSSSNPDGVERSRAVRDAIRSCALTDSEAEVLCNATHTPREELPPDPIPPTYSITNRTSGVALGSYEGASPEQAIDAMHRDAGYVGTEGAADALGTTVEALRAELLTEATLTPGGSDAEYPPIGWYDFHTAAGRRIA